MHLATFSTTICTDAFTRVDVAAVLTLDYKATLRGYSNH